MQIEHIDSETFTTYPEVSDFVNRQNAEGKACLVTNCNDGFIVDVYEEKPTL